MKKFLLVLIMFISIGFVHQHVYATPIRMDFSGYISDVSILEDLEDDLGVYAGDRFQGVLYYDPYSYSDVIDLGGGNYIYSHAYEYTVTVNSLVVASSVNPDMLFRSHDGMTDIHTMDFAPNDNDTDFYFHYASLAFAPVAGDWVSPYQLSGSEFMSLTPTVFEFGGDIQHPDAPFGSAGEGIVAAVGSYAFQPVPEPSTLILIGSGLLGIAGVYRKKKAAKGNTAIG